jgi:hypothetical protein
MFSSVCGYQIRIGRNVTLLDDPKTLEKLMRRPRLPSYGLMKSLDVQWIPEHDLRDLEKALRRRIFQSQVSAFGWHRMQEDWDAGIDDQVTSCEALWSLEHKPSLETLKVASQRDDLTSSLLQL